ncbi:unnamed protein product [Lactuca virosa]|uniref:Nuclease associated modular domain-containing protein n=1 Tax=Lactuca virosa TaxID=75947 RepID=A0AAU9MMF6_9ASTR|nr:unnamed protein product [Lactuca virosa]
MPLLDIATPQSSFRNNPYSIGFQRLHHVSFISGNQTTARSRFFKPNGIINPASGRLMIKAVATLEPRCSDNANHQLPIDSTPTLPGTDDQPVVIDDREILRRSRISDANRGKQPWNKGRKHSAETREKIRESTRIAMRSETVRMKLRKAIHSQTLETRSKIAAAVRVTWNKRRFQQRMMSHCQQEWRNLVSEASRKGFCGEEELQWDSYEIIQKQLTKEYRAGVESRKEHLRTNSLKPEGQRGVSHLRAPKTPEQRKKISEAIAAKWADPTYRERVYSGISKRRGLDPENRDPEWGTGKRRKEATKLNPSPRKKRESFGGGTKVKSPQQPKVKTSVSRVKKEPQARFKDPQANYKLEMIKSIRAQRAGSDSDSDPKINEAVLRANVLIGEAQRAAEALEEAAAKSPVAEASLIETRKLIAEAIRYIESIEMGNNQSLESGNDKDEKMVVEDVRGIEQRGVNGIGGMGLSDGGIGMLADVANGRENIDILSSASTWGDMGLEMKEVEGDGDGGRKMMSEKQERKGRRWVCGRLVEDEEDE